MNEEGHFILVSWKALAFVFAILPGIVAIAYSYECGRKHIKPKLSGYMSMLKVARKSKAEAYQKTAETLLPSSGFKQMSRGLTWLFILAVALVGSNIILTLSILILSIPASLVAHYIGKRKTF